MEVFAVVGWDNYYPSPDNVLDGKLYRSREEAQQALNEFVGSKRDDMWEQYDFVEIFVYDLVGEE